MSRVDRALALALAALAATSGGGPAARERVALSGLVDAEAWNTASASPLLSRNDGDPASLLRLRLWAAAELVPGLTALTLGRVATGSAGGDGETHAFLDQAYVRYHVPGRIPLLLEAGRIALPFGNFSARYLSSANPLIGQPATYGLTYPLGASLAGRFGRLDWKAAILDRPLTDERLPGFDAAPRPALSLGVTPAIGVRLAAYWTAGPYLGSGVAPLLPASAGWRDFDQRVTGLEFAFSRGYFEVNGDFLVASYDVPTRARPARGQTWFVEPRYAWTPRLFTALRVERSDYPLIAPVSELYWGAENAAFVDAEIGAGWRFAPDLVLKASYRVDRWSAGAAGPAAFPDGQALALQLSWGFDVNAWLRRPF